MHGVAAAMPWCGVRVCVVSMIAGTNRSSKTRLCFAGCRLNFSFILACDMQSIIKLLLRFSFHWNVCRQNDFKVESQSMNRTIRVFNIVFIVEVPIAGNVVSTAQVHYGLWLLFLVSFIPFFCLLITKKKNNNNNNKQNLFNKSIDRMIFISCFPDER